MQAQVLSKLPCAPPSHSSCLELSSVGGGISSAQQAQLQDISTVLPPAKISGDVQLPSGIYSGELRISSASVKLAATKLGDFVLKGRIVIDGSSHVVLENVVVDGSRPGLAGSPDQLLEIQG
jgi:hypothetical protein